MLTINRCYSFFQTKSGEFNIGEGLGLAIVKNIVQSLGGSVELSSNEDEGTELIIKLRNYKLSPNDNVEDHMPKPPFSLKHGIGKV